MANITRYSPFTELANFDLFNDDFFRGFSLRPIFQEMKSEPQMRLEVSEDDKNYTIKAEIPGVTKEDIHISIDGNQVSISAEVKKETEEKEGEKVIRSERYYGSVSRSFSLAQKIDQANANAKYENGILLLTLPKTSGGTSKKLAVS